MAETNLLEQLEKKRNIPHSGKLQLSSIVFNLSLKVYSLAQTREEGFLGILNLFLT
jgi:hypothetical protein